MGILKSAARGLKNLTRGRGLSTLGNKISNSKWNIGSWGEDIASGLGIRTRGEAKYLNAGRPFKKGTTSGARGYAAEFAEPDIPDQAAIAATGGYRNLTGAGIAAQLGSYGAVGGLGAYLMSGGKQTDNATDKNGVKDPSYDEDRAKVIDNYKMDKLGGASGFNTDLYQAVSKDSQWVKTAIANMGKERYMQLRKAALNDPSKGQAVHNELVKALSKSGDTEALKQAAKEPYVLPGLARTKDGVPRVVVISPQTDKKSKKTSYTALQFDWEEPEDQQ